MYPKYLEMTDMKTEPIPYLGYCFAFMGKRTAYSDYFALEASESGSLLCARLDNRFAGYICASDNGRDMRVTHAYTCPEYRGQGIFTALLKEIADNAEKTVRVNIPTDHEYHDTVVHICEKLGFTKGESVTIYTLRPSSDPKLREYIGGKGTRICDMLRRHGYKTVSFEDADDDIIRQIRDSDINGFKNPFETRSFFDEPARKLSRRISFAAVRDGEPAAYTLVSLPSPKKGVLEQISVSEKKLGTGVILLPFIETVRAFIENGGQIATYAMYGSNTAANAFRENISDKASEKEAENYYLQKGIYHGKYDT